MYIHLVRVPQDVDAIHVSWKSAEWGARPAFFSVLVDSYVRRTWMRARLSNSQLFFNDWVVIYDRYPYYRDITQLPHTLIMTHTHGTLIHTYTAYPHVHTLTYACTNTHTRKHAHTLYHNIIMSHSHIELDGTVVYHVRFPSIPYTTVPCLVPDDTNVSGHFAIFHFAPWNWATQQTESPLLPRTISQVGVITHSVLTAEDALPKLNNNKASWICTITAELRKSGGFPGINWLVPLFTPIWKFSVITLICHAGKARH